MFQSPTAGLFGTDSYHLWIRHPFAPDILALKMLLAQAREPDQRFESVISTRINRHYFNVESEVFLSTMPTESTNCRASK
jgi:hypothetical protein